MKILPPYIQQRQNMNNTISQHSTEQHSQIRVTKVDSGIETSEAEPM